MTTEIEIEGVADANQVELDGLLSGMKGASSKWAQVKDLARAEGLHGGIKRGGDRRPERMTTMAVCFSEHVHNETGIPVRTVRRRLAISKKLTGFSDEAKEMIDGTWLANDLAVLVRVASDPKPLQVGLLTTYLAAGPQAEAPREKQPPKHPLRAKLVAKLDELIEKLGAEFVSEMLSEAEETAKLGADVEPAQLGAGDESEAAHDERQHDEPLGEGEPGTPPAETEPEEPASVPEVTPQLTDDERAVLAVMVDKDESLSPNAIASTAWPGAAQAQRAESVLAGLAERNLVKARKGQYALPPWGKVRDQVLSALGA